MPSYAVAGVIGGVVALGFLIWTIWTQNAPRLETPYQTNFNPDPDYDRPRSSRSNFDNDEDERRPRRRRRTMRESECVICTEVIHISDRRCLPCEHFFHNACITKWFREGSRTCPTCRLSCPA